MGSREIQINGEEKVMGTTKIKLHPTLHPRQGRVFDGEVYMVINSGPVKSQEHKMAQKYRDRGYNVRLVKSGNQWAAYARRRKR